MGRRWYEEAVGVGFGSDLFRSGCRTGETAYAETDRTVIEGNLGISHGIVESL
jgi:hypothetical protein